jgi:hypothetical protein
LGLKFLAVCFGQHFRPEFKKDTFEEVYLFSQNRSYQFYEIPVNSFGLNLLIKSTPVVQALVVTTKLYFLELVNPLPKLVIKPLFTYVHHANELAMSLCRYVAMSLCRYVASYYNVYGNHGSYIPIYEINFDLAMQLGFIRKLLPKLIHKIGPRPT